MQLSASFFSRTFFLGLLASVPVVFLGSSPAAALTFVFDDGTSETANTADDLTNTDTIDAILGLDIGGLLYDVHFQSGSFVDVFGDADGLDFSTLTQAEDAFSVVVLALGSEGSLTESSGFSEIVGSSRFDGFLVPFGFAEGPNRVSFTADSSPELIVDGVEINQVDALANFGLLASESGGFASKFAWADFKQSAEPPTAVPTPALLPGLLGFGASLIRKRRLAQSDAA